MTREQARLEQLRRFKLAAAWAPVVWFPLVVYSLSIEATRAASGLALVGVAFAGAARLAVWSARCPRCGQSFRSLSGGFRWIWEESGCLACGLSLFALRRARPRGDSRA